ncbi:MAG: helix-turn-helix transcriptional regulator [Clostridia bacterium]|nr:helix-turn-helix transcriptional regulator [Clostridia bacterium]
MKTTAAKYDPELRGASYDIFRVRSANAPEELLHHHDFYEIIYIVNGNVSYSIESSSFSPSSGDFVLISPFELHLPISTPTGIPYELIVLRMTPAFMEAISGGEGSLSGCFNHSGRSKVNLLRSSGRLAPIMSGLMECILKENETEDFGNQQLAKAAITHLLVLANRLSVQAGEDGKADMSLASRVLAYIGEHYAEDITLDLLAKEFFVSKYHLSHEFSKTVGTSVYRYLIKKRLMIAKQLMTMGDTPVKVCQKCGFGDYANFYRAFRNEYQVSPKEYVTFTKRI